jgi:hypothetical protein
MPIGLLVFTVEQGNRVVACWYASINRAAAILSRCSMQRTMFARRLASAPEMPGIDSPAHPSAMIDTERQMQSIGMVVALVVTTLGLHAPALAQEVELRFVHDAAVSSGPRFALITGGRDDFNRYERDDVGNYARERRYVRDSVARGAVIADGALVPVAMIGGAARGVIVVTGHLEEAEVPKAGTEEIALWIDVCDAARDTCVTLAVRIAELRPRGSYERYERYQSLAVAFDLSSAMTASDAFRIRVRYAGAASLALRSLTVRGIAGE